MISLEESFAEGSSAVHKLDPRIRIFFACAFSIIIAVMDSFPALILSILFAFSIVGFARLNLIAVLRRLTVVAGFLILIWIMLPITFEGNIISKIGPFNIYREGIILASEISLKSIAILMIFIALVTTMTVNSLGHVLYSFKLPVKLVFLLLITYRYIFVIGSEYERLRTAMKIRGFKSKTNMHSFRSIAYLIGMLFVRASLRAERVDQAMRLRGFNGRFYSLEDFEGYNLKILPVIMMSVFAGLLIYLEWFHKF